MSARTVTGKATGVGQANSFGFANVKIETNSGQTEWAATKVAGIIGEARRAKEAGEVRSFDLTDVVAEKINPQTGQPYVNTYIEAIRPPAAEEVNGSDVAGAVTPNVTYTANASALPLPTQTPNPRNEFQRSKEEMRWTEALHIAAVLVGPGSGTIVLGETARLVEALIQEKA